MEPTIGRDAEPGSTAARSGRIAALVLLACAGLLAFGASKIEFAFSSDPLGPRALPYLLAGMLGVLGLWYLAQPGEAEPWPTRGTALRSLLLIVVTGLAILAMPYVGFIITAAVICGLAALLFGASPLMAIVSGIAQSLFWFSIFKLLLGTYLPWGSLLFPGW